jgi:hypothetical protein
MDRSEGRVALLTTAAVAAGPEQSLYCPVRSFPSTALGGKLKNSEELHPPPSKSNRVCRRTAAAFVVAASMLPSRRGILGCTVVVHRQLARSLRRSAVSSSVRCTQDTHRPGSSPTHRIYIAPESRRTVTFSPPRWRQHFCHSVCCIWQAYVTAFGLAPGLTGQRLRFTSWLLGSVTRRRCRWRQ